MSTSLFEPDPSPDTPDDRHARGQHVHWFVYGTLCTGQCRETCWPRRPITVRPAWVRGRLFAGSDYPAMTPGDRRVAGQCWTFPADDEAEVMRVLDQIEGTNQPGHRNLYDRIRVNVTMLGDDGPAITAWTYVYAIDPLANRFVELPRSVPAGETVPGDALVRWPE